MTRDSTQTETPILLLVFNRPEVTRKVFDVIRKVKPRRLYVAGDGAREDRPGEAALCKQVREAVSNVDWPCEVKTLFRDANLGCKMAVSSAISWFFDDVEEGIVLEDDCLPDPSFFAFCSALLSRYRDDERIMVISGNHLCGDERFGNASYYFTRIPHIWGWATWRRAWQLYDVEMQCLPAFVSRNAIASIFASQPAQQHFMRVLGRVRKGEVDTWDYQLCLSVWANHGLCINPQTNLVTNIGYGGDATHTKSGPASQWTQLPIGTIGEITHPDLVVSEPRADILSIQAALRPQPLLARLRNKVSGTLDRWRT